MPRELRQQIRDVGLHDLLVLPHAEMARHGARVLELVERVLVEADRRRHDAVGAARIGHRGDDGGRVDAAREERAERHVADETQPHRFGDERLELLQILILARGIAVAGERQIPVAAHRHAAALGHQQMRRRQLEDPRVHRLRRRHVLKRKVGVERFGAPAARHVGILEQRFDLGAEGDARGGRAVIERLDAEPIADEEQPALRLVPQREGEHAAEAIDRAVAPLLVRVHDHLGVRVRAEPVAVRLELGADLGEVVDLAVEDDPDRAVLVRQRLIAGRKVDDAETTVAEADALADVEPVGVGAAVRDDARHRGEAFTIDRICRVEIEFAGDAAHVRKPPIEVGPRRRRRGA